MRIEQVFPAGGQPTDTFVPRGEATEGALQRYLRGAHSFLSIEGPTKSGKTVLCRKVIPPDKLLWIAGGSINTETEFWTQAVARLGIATKSSSSTGRETSYEGKIQAEASGLLSWLTKLGGSFSRGSKKTANSVHEFTADPKSSVLQNLKVSGKTLVIDDFHYLPADVRKSVVRALKEPVEQGQSVIIVSVPHRGFDIERSEPEIQGRVTHLSIPKWREDELRSIAEKGFAALNVTSSAQLANRLAKEAMGSPHIMQSLCKYVCENNGIEARVQESRTIRVADWEKLLSGYAKQLDAFQVKRFIQLRGGWGERTKREFIAGGSGDIFVVVLTAIAGLLPSLDIQQNEILRKVEELVTKPPQRNEVTRVLEKISEAATEVKDRPFEWDPASRTLYLLDPFFAFALKHGEWGAGPR